jgi:hypothetical protein
MHPLFDVLRKTYPDNQIENFLDESGLRVASFTPEDDLIAAHLAAQADQLVKDNAEAAADTFTGLLTTIIAELTDLQRVLDGKANGETSRPTPLSALEQSVLENLTKMRDIFYLDADGAIIVVNSDLTGTFIDAIIFTKNGGELSFKILSPAALEAMKQRVLATGWVNEPENDEYWLDTFEEWYVEFPPLPYGTHELDLDD